MVLPNPARAREEAASRGDTRVKGSLAIPALFEAVIEDEEFDREDDVDEREDEELPSVGSRLESKELFNDTSAGSKVHTSHRSKVAFVSPNEFEGLSPGLSNDVRNFPSARGFRRIPKKTWFITSHPPRSLATSAKGTTTAWRHID